MTSKYNEDSEEFISREELKQIFDDVSLLLFLYLRLYFKILHENLIRFLKTR